ncbi:MAG: hypothetical protein ACK4UN_00175 [Limisphaerales bacterium]
MVRDPARGYLSAFVADRKGKVEVVHYRPAKDDLVVYNPQRDELRICAKTKGEQELYLAAFGQYLHGVESYYRATDTYSLEPLRELGLEALAWSDIPGIRKVLLTKLEMEIDLNKLEPVTSVWKGKDLFGSMASSGGFLPIPINAKLVTGVFRICLKDSRKTLNVKIGVPNVIQVENKPWATGMVQDWLEARRFKSFNPAAIAVAA